MPASGEVRATVASESPILVENLWREPARRRLLFTNHSLLIWLTGFAMFGIFFAWMALIQFASPDLVGNDGYYHIRFAELMRREGLRPDFPWLPLTILNPREFYDHHFLYHVALIPFTLGALIQGAKWASVLFASLAFTSVWGLLRSQRVPFPALWAIGLLAVSGAFIYRMSMARAQSLSLAVLVIGLYLMFNRKHKWLAMLSFFYVWLYDAFPLIVVTAAIYVVSAWIIEKKLDFQPVLYSGVGVGLGMLINPYFPDNVVFVLRHILPKLAETTSVRVGNEWYPYDTGQLLENSPLALVAFAAGVIGLGLRERRMDVQTATVLTLSLLFGLMLFQSRRFVEYFPAFALLFAAFAWRPLLSPRAGDQAGSNNGKGRSLSSLTTTGTVRGWLPGLVLSAFLIPGIIVASRNAMESIRDSKPAGIYSAAAHWLMENTPPGSRVFQTDWDDFTRLFFYNTHNTYLVGLDPTYLSLYNGQLYEHWVEITQGDVDQPSELIAGTFGAEFIFSDLDHTDFIGQAEKDPNIRTVYRDDEAVIFRIIP